MGGVNQSEYLIPHEQCTSFLHHLESRFRVDLITGEIGNSGFLIQYDHPLKKHHPPMLSFWPASLNEKNRRVDFNWIKGEEDFAAIIDETVKRYGGTKIFP